MSQFPRFSVPRQPLIFCLLISLIAVKFHQIYSAAEIDGCHLCVLETLDINRNWLVNGQLKEDSWKAGPIQKNEDLTKGPTMQRIPRKTCWVKKNSWLRGTGGLWTRVPCNCEREFPAGLQFLYSAQCPTVNHIFSTTLGRGCYNSLFNENANSC